MDGESPTPEPGKPKPPIRKGLVSVVTGTRPGLERFLLASVPALTVGAVGAALFGRGIGLSAGVLTLVGVMLAARRVGSE
jgi:hypothetical protein